MLVLLATTPTAATKCSSEPEGLTAVARLQSIVEDSTAYSLAILPGIRLGYERGYERHIYRRGYVRGFEHGYDFKIFKAACPSMDNAPAVCLSLFAFNAACPSRGNASAAHSTFLAFNAACFSLGNASAARSIFFAFNAACLLVGNASAAHSTFFAFNTACFSMGAFNAACLSMGNASAAHYILFAFNAACFSMGNASAAHSTFFAYNTACFSMGAFNAACFSMGNASAAHSIVFAFNTACFSMGNASAAHSIVFAFNAMSLSIGDASTAYLFSAATSTAVMTSSSFTFFHESVPAGTQPTGEDGAQPGRPASPQEAKLVMVGGGTTGISDHVPMRWLMIPLSLGAMVGSRLGTVQAGLLIRMLGILDLAQGAAITPRETTDKKNQATAFLTVEKALLFILLGLPAVTVTSMLMITRGTGRSDDPAIHLCKQPPEQGFSRMELEELNVVIFRDCLRSHTCVQSVQLSSQPALELALYCKMHWQKGPFKLPSGVAVPGFNGYDYTLKPRDGNVQVKDTSLLSRPLLARARKELSSFSSLESEVLAHAAAHPASKGRKPFVREGHLLRQQGSGSLGSSLFSGHLDTWNFTVEKPALTYVVLLSSDGTSKMRVVGAPTYCYGVTPGSTACFPSGCAHESVEPEGEFTTYKIAFFVAFKGCDYLELAEYPLTGLDQPPQLTPQGPSESQPQERPEPPLFLGPQDDSVPTSRRSKRERKVALLRSVLPAPCGDHRGATRVQRLSIAAGGARSTPMKVVARQQRFRTALRRAQPSPTRRRSPFGSPHADSASSSSSVAWSSRWGGCGQLGQVGPGVL